jgi:hypothetical protein
MLATCVAQFWSRPPKINASTPSRGHPLEQVLDGLDRQRLLAGLTLQP